MVADANGNTTLILPRRALVVLCGPAGAGRSTFAAEVAQLSHLATSAVVSSDACRLLLCDRLDSLAAAQWAELQTPTNRLFVIIVEMRMGLGRPVLADGVNLQRQLRAELLGLAHTHGYRTLLVVFDVPFLTCLAQNAQRVPSQHVPERLIRAQRQALEDAIPRLTDEGWDHVVLLDGQRRTVRIALDAEDAMTYRE